MPTSKLAVFMLAPAFGRAYACISLAVGATVESNANEALFTLARVCAHAALRTVHITGAWKTTICPDETVAVRVGISGAISSIPTLSRTGVAACAFLALPGNGNPWY